MICRANRSLEEGLMKTQPPVQKSMVAVARGTLLSIALIAMRGLYNDYIVGAMAIAIVVAFFGIAAWSRSRAWRAEVRSIQKTAENQQSGT